MNSASKMEDKSIFHCLIWSKFLGKIFGQSWQTQENNGITLKKASALKG